MPNNIQEPSRNESHSSFFQSLPRPQRTAFLLLSVLSLGVFILWIWQFNDNLNRPFRTEGENIANETSLDSFKEALLNSDTDSDGLTDQEESGLYGTSQYVADTDSDGINDREEIEQGTNPNCAAGAVCAEDEPAANTPVVPAVTLSTSTVVVSDSASEDDLQAMMSGEADVAQLRALLLDSGADASMLANLSDEELIAAYQDMLAGQAKE